MRCLVGTDLEDVVRFRRILDRKPRLLSGLFFAQELDVAKTAPHIDQTLSGYWCAKEAVIKAFAPVLGLDIWNIEITKDLRGFPKVVIHHPEVDLISFQLSISISHTKNYATATALLTIL
ncbi:holo-ACP synthase [Lunatibacter salilacus]|uniref:holo-ACP synthase n=1 Tax=Lunatibacter salilacus TaxID=2483804 RepID=UPI00131B0775|nr:4'-phosphopantetheinyl transferase superfamily protein [Lunatibacter salilacus]